MHAPKSRLVLALLSVAALVVVGGVLLLPHPLRQRHDLRCVAWLTAQQGYGLTAARCDTVYFTITSPDTAAPTCRLAPPDAPLTPSYGCGAWMSKGRVVTTTRVVAAPRRNVLNAEALPVLLSQLREEVQALCATDSAQRAQLNYYLATHDVQDEGYNQVALYHEAQQRRQAYHRRTDSLLRRLQDGDSLHVCFVTRASARLFDREGRLAGEPISCIPTTDTPHNGLLTLQTETRTLPAGAKTLRRPLFSLMALSSTAHPRSVTALGVPHALLPEEDTALRAAPRRATAWKTGPTRHYDTTLPLLRCAEGAPVLDARGVWVATVSQEGLIGLHQREYSPSPTALQARTRYEGGMNQGLREGPGRLTLRNGQQWEGTWNGDTLAYGTLTDGTGTYEGEFNAALRPHGFGILHTSQGQDYFEGYWNNGQPDGFGFGLWADEGVRCGWYTHGRFLGERKLFHANRVYGIDISHYQHGGRPRGRFRGYGIDWKRLRITSLGPNSKNSTDAVDYPVSFCYIKSTQGIRILNNYYSRDARDARRAGLHVGAYHFFSPSAGLPQAKWFLRKTTIAPDDLPPMLDVELSAKQRQQMGGDSILFEEMLVWLRFVEQHTGKRPILYISQTFATTLMPEAPKALRDYRVWIARYSEYSPYVGLLYWQLTPFGRVRGIRGEVDIDVFNGSPEQFQRYVESGGEELP